MWGDESVGIVEIKRTKRQVFEDYDAFVAKFKKDAPKTTDDCFTPQNVYEAVLGWLRERVDLRERPIVRPFYPGGDYENEEYPENCVVVDNPPFSILARIIRFYQATGIDYFLFGPGLTLFGVAQERNCAIVTNSAIVYANGAKVLTGFHTSLFPGYRILVSTTLHDAIQATLDKRKVSLQKYEYPPNIVTAARLHTAIGGG